MRTWADSTLMSMKKSDLIECLRCAEHNQAVAEKQLAQHIENVKDWVPVVRCKDCKYSTLPSAFTQQYGKPGTLTCHNKYAPCNRRNVSVNDFCSYGERL